MTQFAVSTVVDVSASRALIALGLTNNASDVTAWMVDAEARIADINDALVALSTTQSGSSAPSNVRGQLWSDTSQTNRVRVYVDPDGNGADDQVLSAAEGFRVSLATGGTATHKLNGAINVNTTQASKAGATGVLMTYTLPANTLDTNGKYIHVVCFGTKVTATAVMSLQPRLGTTAITTHTMAANCTDWAIEFWVVRTAAGGQDCGSYMVLNRDDTGSTTLCDFASLSKDETTNLAVDINVSAINAADTATQEIMLVEFFN